MMHKHHPASNLQTTPSSPQAFRLIPLGKPAPSRNHLPRQQQQPPASAMHRRGQDQEQGQGRNRGRSKKAYGYSGRNSRSNIGFVGPQQITDPTYEQHHDTNNDRLFSDGHGLDLAHIYESNISPHLQSQIAPKAAVWGSHVSIRSSDHPSNPSHLYSVRPTGSPNLLARVPRQDHHMYPSPHLLHGGGMAAYRVNGEATLGVGSTQYEVSDHITFHGHVPRYQPLAAKRFIKTHLPPGSVAMYTTPAFAPAPSHTFPNALSAYPIDLNPPVSSSLVPMGQYPSPWVYSTFAPPPPQLPPSVLLSPPSLMMTSRTLPPGPLGDHHPAATDEQDDIEVVLGIPDRISETESTVSSSSGVKEVEMASIQVSHMDEKQFLPISVIANFKMVKALTSEIDEIVEALRMSPLVVVDESGTMVKPNVIKRPRTTLILRDLPLDTVEEEIRQVFEMEGQCSPETITKEVGNNWFVDFATEEKALAMLAFTRGRCIRGVPIAGRLKSTTTLAGLEYRLQDTSVHQPTK
ncbi:La- protein 4B [Actinomortierella ambigua]|nr:La- protein 4B [Actinomortierella ambigua]